MNVDDVLRLPIMRSSRFVAGERGRLRLVKGVSVIDHPLPGQEVAPNHLLLTTGYAWPREEPSLLSLVQNLQRTPVAGIGMSVPQFFDRVPAAVRDFANASDLPVLEIPWEVPIAKVSEAVNRALLKRYSELVDRLELIHYSLTRAAVEATSIPDLVATFGRLLQRDVVLEDPFGTALGSWALSSGAGERPCRSRSRPKTRVPSVRVLREHGYLEGGLSRAAIQLPADSSSGTPACVLAPIRLSDELVGFVKVLQGHTPLTDVDIHMVEHVATVTALHISYRQHLQQQQVWMSYKVLESVLESDSENLDSLKARALQMGILPDVSYVVAVVLWDEELPLTSEGFTARERILERVRQNMRDLGYSVLVAPIMNRTVLVLPAGGDLVSCLHGLGSHEWRILIGRSHLGLSGVRQSYQEAMSLLDHVSVAGVHRFDEWLVPRTLMGDARARMALLERTIHPLRDTRDGETLEATLRAWVAADFNYSDTAKCLGIHRNTLYYRLERVSDVLDVNLADSDTRFELQLSTRLSDPLHKS